MKYIIAMKEGRAMFEFPTKEARDEFIEEVKDEEYATTEIEE